mmetsp:Transcript_90090/g.226720  ORF Transcript_90090/g.226720 Transcript_90090/m.226720 type:complete len:770 (+) Transcript_90090:84-2393(+)
MAVSAQLWEQTQGAAQRLSQWGVSAAQAVQDTTTRTCSVCHRNVLRAVASDCTFCGQAYCRNCKVVLIGPTGSSIASAEEAMRAQISACKTCEQVARKQRCEANILERMKRVEAYLEGRLQPYEYTAEGKMDKALRLGGHAMYGIKQVVGFLPIGQLANAIKAGYYLVRYGPLILSGNDILEAFQLIVSLAKSLDTDKNKLVSPDFFGGLYYMMGEHWGERSKSPELEFQEHVDAQGAVPTPGQDDLLRLHYLLRLLIVSREATSTDAQRLLRQAVPGAELVLAEMASGEIERAFLLACIRSEKVLYMILPGTTNTADFVADFDAEGEAIDNGVGHRGMVRSARWLWSEVGPVITRLHSTGYRVVIVGHSLGAGVGALLTLLCRPTIPSVKCYGFGTPACVDENLIPAFVDCMVSVVNRDDAVPRLTVRNIEALVNSVLCAGQVAKTQAWMAEDMKAIKDVERVVELRRRRSSVVDPQAAVPEDDAKLAILIDAGIQREAAQRALRLEGGDVSLAMLRATEEEAQSNSPSQAQEESIAMEVDTASSAPPAADAGASASAAIADGWQRFNRFASGYVSNVQTTVERMAGDHRLSLGGLLPGGTSTAQQAAVAAQVRHVPFFIPGQIVHLFGQNGLSRPAWAPATHQTFAHIIVSQDMLNDHKLCAYSDALHQALITRPATPRWEPFHERKVCACCEDEFNWAFVLASEPQRMLARHHCFACGRAVCDGCSQRRLAHPQLGFARPVRTCDSCFFKCYAGAPLPSSSSSSSR